MTGIQSVFGNDPIYELTLPSITWHMNEDVKLVAEMMWQINTPIVTGDDGVYVLSEQVATANSGPTTRSGLIPAGRMMFQIQI